jgi:FkbM family methyltransferase
MGILTVGKKMLRKAGVDACRWPWQDPGYRRALLLDFLKVDLVIDVGANIGQFGSEIRSFGYHGDILSLEPTSDAFGRLATRIERDARWVGMNCAAGSKTGTAMINVAKNSYSSSLLQVLERSVTVEPGSDYCAQETVNLVTLDRLIAEQGYGHARPYLKIDTQGYEGEVLAGAVDCSRRAAAIELELSLVPLYGGAPTFNEMVSRITKLGYSLKSLNPGFWDTKTGELLQVDAILVREDVADEMSR